MLTHPPRQVKGIPRLFINKAIISDCQQSYYRAILFEIFPPCVSPVLKYQLTVRLLILNADLLPLACRMASSPVSSFCTGYPQLLVSNSAYRTCLNCRERQHIDHRRHVLQPSSQPVTRFYYFFFLNGFFTAAEASAESGSPSSICKDCKRQWTPNPYLSCDRCRERQQICRQHIPQPRK